MKKLKIVTVKVNPYLKPLRSILDEYLGQGKYMSIPAVPIKPRMLINELMLRRDLHDIESGVDRRMTIRESTCKIISKRLHDDLIATIKERHC